MGYVVGETLKEINPEKYIVKSSAGPRYVVGVKNNINRKKLVVGSRVALDNNTMTIVKILPREIDPLVYTMLTEEPGSVHFGDIGGLND